MRRFPVALVLTLGLVVGGGAGVAAHQGHPMAASGIEHVVRPGDTLWSIAETAYPGSDPRVGVDRIIRANQLHGALLIPGSAVVVPTP